VQNDEIPRNIKMAEMPSVRNSAQADENERKNSLLDYESPTLTAELQARISDSLKHSTLLPSTRKAREIS
jgi:hypothetical protein